MLLDVYRDRLAGQDAALLCEELGLTDPSPLVRQQGEHGPVFDLLTRGVLAQPERLAPQFGVEPKVPPKELNPVHPNPADHTQHGLMTAILVDRMLREGGFDFRPGAKVLDFGAGAGRVVRYLSPAYPELEWHACDVVDELVDWGRRHITDVTFGVSPVHPPATYEADSLAAIFAISVFSHLVEDLALTWMHELYRILEPGGLLFITVLGRFNIDLRRDPDKLGGKHGMEDVDFDQVMAQLEERGFVYVDACKRARQLHPILADPPYGAAFMLPKWFERAGLDELFEVAHFQERALSAQDGITLRKRG
jgi:SAM-dependent methyltransferase